MAAHWDSIQCTVQHVEMQHCSRCIIEGRGIRLTRLHLKQHCPATLEHLRLPNQRPQCCHHHHQSSFDSQALLNIATWLLTYAAAKKEFDNDHCPFISVGLIAWLPNSKIIFAFYKLQCSTSSITLLAAPHPANGWQGWLFNVGTASRGG